MIATNHAHYHLLRMHEMGRLFLAHSLAVVSNSLIGVFVPIYLLNLGYSFKSVLLFLAIQGIFAIPLQSLAAFILIYLGPHRIMALGIFMQILYFSTLTALSTYHWPLWIPAFFWGFYRATYFLGFHINFSRAEHHENSAKEVGSVQALATFAKGIAPAIGGLVAMLAGIQWIYAVGIGLSVAAMLPLVTHRERPYKYLPSMKRLSLRKIRVDMEAILGNAATTVSEGILWPILVFFIVGTYVGVGVLSSIAALASIITALYVGARSQKKGARHFMSEGVTLSSLTDVTRLMAQNAAHVFGINFFTGIGNSLYYTPYFSRFYTHASEESRIEYVAIMETIHEATWASIFLLLLLLSMFLPDKTVLLVGIAFIIPANFLIRRIR